MSIRVLGKRGRGEKGRGQMSLDVYLTGKEIKKRESSGIFIRDNGFLKEISMDEWLERNPGQTPIRLTEMADTNEIFSANVTHNLNEMAKEAGIYEYLWRPEEIGITKASQLIEPLRKGLELMESDPSRFEKLNPENGWGSYERFVPWIREYLNACIENPNAEVGVSR
jgi:hypothetical protein